MSPTSTSGRRPVFRFLPFLLWLTTFYVVWASLVIGGDRIHDVLNHWPIALAMLGGSFVAGSTPMGGGTVGFPVLVLLFDQPASLGRNFGLAIQSIGMVSASIFILCSRTPLDLRLLRPALIGTLIGTPLGAAFVAPWVPDQQVKIVFAVLWSSFGLMHLIKMKTIVGFHVATHVHRPIDPWIGTLIGVGGGIVASITGVGIDMIYYVVVVLLYRFDMRVAIPTSVILMASTSLVGIASNAALSAALPERYAIDPEVFRNWLAAAPIVAVGAPLGAYAVALFPRTFTLVFVSILCVAQFVWTCVQERLSGWTLVIALLSVLATNAVFHVLFTLGRRVAEASPRGIVPSTPPPSPSLPTASAPSKATEHC